jgi:hypothetical protein
VEGSQAERKLKYTHVIINVGVTVCVEGGILCVFASPRARINSGVLELFGAWGK